MGGMAYSKELMNRVRSGNPEIEGLRNDHVVDLERHVCRGDYQVPSPDIVAALLLSATLARLYSPQMRIDVR